MKVLYVSHTGLVEGGEHSLLDTLRVLPADVEAVLATPAGPLAELASVRTIELPPIEATLAGNMVHGVRSIRRCARALRTITRKEQPEIVHANSIRAGLVACALAIDVPVVVSIRDCLPPGLQATVTRRRVHRRADLLIANSNHTRRSFQGSTPIAVIYPGVDLSPFEPSRLISTDEARRALDLGDSALVLGVVAQLTPWKGQDDAIRILARVRDRHPTAVLLLVGASTFSSASFDNDAYEERLRALATSLHPDGAVRFLGRRDDVPAIMRALDLLLVPSWEEPFGRTVVEALAAGVAVAATATGGPAETLVGTDGLLLPPRRPEAWVEPLLDLLDGPYSAPAAIAQRQTAAQRFAAGTHVDQLVSAYEALVPASSKVQAVAFSR